MVAKKWNICDITYIELSVGAAQIELRSSFGSLEGKLQLGECVLCKKSLEEWRGAESRQ
jgi:hypothetical protein